MWYLVRITRLQNSHFGQSFSPVTFFANRYSHLSPFSSVNILASHQSPQLPFSPIPILVSCHSRQLPFSPVAILTSCHFHQSLVSIITIYHYPLLLTNLYRAWMTHTNTQKCCTVCKHLQCNTCKCLSITMAMTCLVPTALDSHCPNRYFMSSDCIAWCVSRQNGFRKSLKQKNYQFFRYFYIGKI